MSLQENSSSSLVVAGANESSTLAATIDDGMTPPEILLNHARLVVKEMAKLPLSTKISQNILKSVHLGWFH